MLVLPVSRTQSTNCAVPVGCENFSVQSAMAAGRAVDKDRLAPHALMHRLPATLPIGFFLGDVLLPKHQGSLQPHWKHRRELLKLNHKIRLVTECKRQLFVIFRPHCRQMRTFGHSPHKIRWARFVKRQTRRKNWNRPSEKHDPTKRGDNIRKRAKSSQPTLEVRTGRAQ